MPETQEITHAQAATAAILFGVVVPGADCAHGYVRSNCRTGVSVCLDCGDPVTFLAPIADDHPHHAAVSACGWCSRPIVGLDEVAARLTPYGLAHGHCADLIFVNRRAIAAAEADPFGADVDPEEF